MIVEPGNDEFADDRLRGRARVGNPNNPDVAGRCGALQMCALDRTSADQAYGAYARGPLVGQLGTSGNTGAPPLQRQLYT